MSYLRVIPRDLFNEANLLKCLAHLWLILERDHYQAEFGVESVDEFMIEQDPNDGSISVVNVPFSVRGKPARLSRPLNSRQPWPLYLEMIDDQDFDPIQVFDINGRLSGDFRNLINQA
jgi:hypothetical protein